MLMMGMRGKKEEKVGKDEENDRSRGMEQKKEDWKNEEEKEEEVVLVVVLVVVVVVEEEEEEEGERRTMNKKFHGAHAGRVCS